MIWEVIRGAMERNGIKSIAELARRTGIKKATLTQTRRKKPYSFLLWEIREIDKILHSTDVEWLLIGDKI